MTMMKTKTMEFEHLVVKYDYNTGTLELHTRVGSAPSNVEPQGYLLDVAQVQELRAALEGIGQQIPGPQPTLRRR